MRKILSAIIAIMFAFTIGCKTNNIPSVSKNSKIIELPAISTIPSLPKLDINPKPTLITQAKMSDYVSKHARIEWLAEDSNYFIPSKANMETIISYLDEVFKKFGIHYIAEGTDCDDFARVKTALSKLIISQAYQIEASPAIFTIFVFQKKPWAYVPAGGGHALIAYACEDENKQIKIFIWEPQGSEIISAVDYPNKDQLFYVGSETTVNPIQEPEKVQIPDKK